jgi:hypothetical protein
MRDYCVTCAQIFSRALVIILLFLGFVSHPRVGIARAASLAPQQGIRPSLADMRIFLGGGGEEQLMFRELSDSTQNELQRASDLGRRASKPRTIL